MRVMLTGGGTGGHLFPCLAVAAALKRMQPPADLLFVGSETGIEATAVAQEGYEFVGLPARPLPRKPSLSLARAATANLRAVRRARRLVEDWKPDVVFATGGFASAPALAAAFFARVPFVLHEQNSVPGVANRIASRYAHEVHLGFSAARIRFRRRDHLRLSGNPIREGIATGSRGKALRLFRLDERRTTIFVFGGSQGAHRINQAIVEALPHFADRSDLQFLIQAGQKDYGWVLDRSRATPVRTWIRPFIVNMGDAYALADLVVCRAGALTLAELAAAGKPAILVPYPHATANHQMKNAEQAVESGAAILLPDADLNGSVLAEKVLELVDDPRRLREMSIRSMRLARSDATERIVRALRRIAGAEEEPAPAPTRPSRGRRQPRKGGVKGRDVAPQGP